MIVATAGHIDHGKTLLVKTLTGVDTDRLPEEKARGISIDLGFAYWPLANGAVIGFVDVPGHERFIRNMLAGVCGINFALITIAADDGVMLQTIEHLNILDLLGITRGVAAITKADRVSPERLEQVRAEVADLLRPTRLSGIPILAVSAVTGAGMDALKEQLAAAASAFATRSAEGQHFRLAIDRAFTIAGSGTVVAGTVFNGAVAVGDRLVVSPKGAHVRVRAIQQRGMAVARAEAGQRCALNLAGADLEAVARGDWILAEPIHAPTQRLDVRISLLASETQALKHWTPVHLHLATADVSARVSLPGENLLAPGGTAIAQLVLAKPIGALNGDRFILRDQSARRTLGGGVVLDPFARAARRATAARRAELAALERGSPEAALAELLMGEPRGVDLVAFRARLQSHGGTCVGPLRGCGPRRPGQGAPRRRHASLARCRARGSAGGSSRLPPSTSRRRREWIPRPCTSKSPRNCPLIRSSLLLRELADERKVVIAGNLARLAGHDTTSNPEDQRIWQLVLPALEQGGPCPAARSPSSPPRSGSRKRH